MPHLRRAGMDTTDIVPEAPSSLMPAVHTPDGGLAKAGRANQEGGGQPLLARSDQGQAEERFDTAF